MATDLKKLFFSDRTTESTYDLDLALKNWQMKIKWQNPNVELAAIASSDTTEVTTISLQTANMRSVRSSTKSSLLMISSLRIS